MASFLLTKALPEISAIDEFKYIYLSMHSTQLCFRVTLGHLYLSHYNVRLFSHVVIINLSAHDGLQCVRQQQARVHGLAHNLKGSSRERRRLIGKHGTR